MFATFFDRQNQNFNISLEMALASYLLQCFTFSNYRIAQVTDLWAIAVSSKVEQVINPEQSSLWLVQLLNRSRLASRLALKHQFKKPF
jgi:hypothetical protein